MENHNQQSPSSEHHEGEIPKDLPKVGTGKVLLATAIFVGILVMMFFIGYIPNSKREAMIEQEAAAVKDAKPTVLVVRAKVQSAGSELLLPGDVRPLQQTSLYPRANGYLKKLLVDIGDSVKEGQLLAEIDTPEVDAQLTQSRAAVQQAQAAISKNQNDFDLAKTTFERYQNFAKSGGVTQQQIDEKQSAYTQANANLASAQASLASSQAEVQRLEAIQGFQKVTAPFAGKITARSFDVGALLSSSGNVELFRLEQTDTLRVFVSVPQTFATTVKVGQDADLLVTNYPGKAFTGKVSRSASSLDASTRTMRFQVDFPNKDGVLYGGMYGQVRFQIRPEQPPLLVPTSALIFNAKGIRIGVIEDKKVKYQPITIGRDFGTEVEVFQGLKGDELLIANPGERLTEGGEVNFTMPKEQPQNAAAPATQPVREAAAR